MSGIVGRIAGAPITWGVCEVPGWGYQMAPSRVLDEMAEVGIRATELGPDGYLPSDPRALGDLLQYHGLHLVAGFLPAVLHGAAPMDEQLAGARRLADLLAAAGGEVLVVAAATGDTGYEGSADLGPAEWETLVAGLDRIIEIGGGCGLTVAFHPHAGTLVEGPEQIRRLLDTSPVTICLDTGHLTIGGADPVDLARTEHARIAHVHLKDVDDRLAELVRSGGIDYQEAVRRGLYRPLGEGTVEVADVVGALETSGYRGWYVLEQDSILESAPDEGSGPVRAAAASVAFLKQLVRDTENSFSA
jgi:inosose dehydratase